jgi:hypothetical protein
MRLRFDLASKIANHKNAQNLDAAGLRIAVTQRLRGRFTSLPSDVC